MYLGMQVWSKMRERILGGEFRDHSTEEVPNVKIKKAGNTEAGYGAALLAGAGYDRKFNGFE